LIPSPMMSLARRTQFLSGLGQAIILAIIGVCPIPVMAEDKISAGRRIVADRQLGLCLLCHPDPSPGNAPQADLAPSLADIGDRLTAAEIRARLINPGQYFPGTIMPAYGPAAGLKNVNAAFANRPILAPDQIDDVVAYLVSLKNPVPQVAP